MPLYEFKNKKTGEIEEHMMKFSDKEKFLEDNPHLQSGTFTPPNMSYNGFKSKESLAGDGWKEVQSRIKSGMPKRFRDNIKSK
tara:strand:+ start:166 stop:414 length:249 start_codon:yes stop_codon:yes gene_type:complete